jgi:MFS transporter, FHS family, glucose/mannose:H+ symporter
MRRFLVTAHLVFVLVGVANTILGPLLPLLTARWHLGDRQAGVLFLVQFVGGFSGAILSTRLARHFSLHGIARAGLLLLAVGFLGLATPWYVVALIGATVNGVGLGLSTPSITASVSESATPQRRASLLNLLNFAWALGAITAPNTVLAALRHVRFQVTGMLVGYAVVLVLAAFLVPRIQVSSHPEEPAATRMPRSILRLIIACGALIFLYVGVENGVAGWLPTFATRIHGFGVERTALLQDTFWVTFLLGRFAAPAFLRLLGERFVLLISILLATLGTCTLLLLAPASQLFISAAAIGLGCAAIMPTAIAILSDRLAGQSGSKLGFMFACAGLGAAVVPFCIGWLSSATNNLRLGMWVLVAVEALLLSAHLVMSRLSRAVDLAPNHQQAIGAAQ